MDWIWYHALPLIVFGVPLIGFLWELLVGLLCRKNCWLLSLPVLDVHSSLDGAFPSCGPQGISAGKSGYAGEWRCAPARRWLSASAY